MPQDKYKAIWVSNSSISDFVACPRLYYLRNIYKDPKTNHKMNIINPALALGQTVHDVLEALSFVESKERFQEPLLEKYDKAWQKVTGKLGGFKTAEEEQATKERGRQMILRVIENPGPFLTKAIKMRKDDPNYLPNYYLSTDENIVLCGKIDWLEWIKADDSVHIIDFKTGKNDESPHSLQLPIYCLLVSNCQKRKVSKGSYWYLDRHTKLTEVLLPTLDEAYNQVLELAKKVKAARLAGEYLCPRFGCFGCEPFEEVVRGKAEFVGVGTYNQDIYILP